VHAFEAHPDYIRCMTVHPTAPIVLTGSDDMTIKAWDWDKNWKCVQVRPISVPLCSVRPPHHAPARSSRATRTTS
jgi:WD40 repeat protein